MRMLVTLALLVGPMSVASPADADWPCFQGPDRNGVVVDTNWFPHGAETPLWTTNVGMGYSCPSIVGGRLVTMGHDPEAELDRVVCLDAESGDELWRHEYDATDTPMYHAGGTLTTPAIHDGVVYTISRAGKAHALDLETGSVRWQRDYRTELDLAETFHGYCASPLVLDEHIVFVFGGVVAATRRDDGETLWRSTDYGDGGYSNSAALTRRGRSCVAVMLAQTFFVFDVASGEVVHEMPWELQGMAVHVATPLVLDDTVFLSTAYNKGCALFRLGDDPAPEMLWSNRRMRNKVTGCFSRDEHIYGFDESMLKCLDMEGNEAWRARGLGMGALAIAGDRLLILSSKGELVVAAAEPDGYRELYRRKVLDGGVYWTMPVLVNGLIYVRNSEGDLACLDHRVDGANTVASSDRNTPEAESLFETHALRVGAERLGDRTALRLTGDLEVLGRGLAREPMTLTLAAPNRWDMRLDDDSLINTFDGDLAWADEPRGVFFFEDEAFRDAQLLFVWPDIVAPACPPDAIVASQPVDFGNTSCWKVDSSAVTHYFDVESGRLVGRDGEGLSTLVYDDVLEIDGVRLPGRITRYVAESGQEESLYLEAGVWIDASDEPFARPPGVRRLLRTPEQIEADDAALRARFAKELGRYHADLEMLPGDEMSLIVDAGQLWLTIGNDPRRVVLESEEDGEFVVAGTGGSKVGFEYDEHGAVVGLRLMLNAGPEGFEEFLLPRIE